MTIGSGSRSANAQAAPGAPGSLDASEVVIKVLLEL
jgi:hypothetical protein